MITNKLIIKRLTKAFFVTNLKYSSVLELHKLNSVSNVSSSLGSGLYELAAVHVVLIRLCYLIAPTVCLEFNAIAIV